MLILKSSAFDQRLATDRMTQQHRKLMQPSATLKWMALLAFAWSQFSFAAHQFEHSADELHETCAVCLQFDRDDDVAIDADVACASQNGVFGVETGPAKALQARRFSHYLSRASP